jgi:hypothetical protein
MTAPSLLAAARAGFAGSQRPVRKADARRKVATSADEVGLWSIVPSELMDIVILVK